MGAGLTTAGGGDGAGELALEPEEAAMRIGDMGISLLARIPRRPRRTGDADTTHDDGPGSRRLRHAPAIP